MTTSSIKHSIKEVAEELGVSKQSVMKYIDKLGLRESLIVSGNAYFLTDKDKAAIKAEFEKKNANQTTTKSTIYRQPNDNKTTTELSNIVELLQQQLAEKDKRIQDLTAELKEEQQRNRELTEKIVGFATTSQELTAKAQTLTAQAQQLHAADKQQLISIEEQQKQAQQEQQIISDPEPEEHKPTFWERLTKKRR